MFKTIIDEYGSCDVLVNNAGITADGLLMRMKPKQWQDVIDINLTGVFYTTQEFFKLAAKKKQKEGLISYYKCFSVLLELSLWLVETCYRLALFQTCFWTCRFV